MIKVMYPGSFDPLTLGHEDIIKRASKMFDVVIVGVLKNETKKSLLTIEERMELIEVSTEHLGNVEVVTFDELLVDYVFEKKIDFILKGLRNNKDFEEELVMAQGIKVYNKEVETLFMPTKPSLSYISSSIIKSLFYNKGTIDNYVNIDVLKKLESRRKNEKDRAVFKNN